MKFFEFLEKFYLSVVVDKSLLKSCICNKEFPPLSFENQVRILNVTINHQLCKKYPPPVFYQNFFLRTLLDAVQEGGYQLSDELIEAYTRSLKASSKPDFLYRTYLITNDYTVTLQESSCFVINSTTGLQTWEASKFLLEWCLGNSHIFRHRTILELGSGVGLLGISVVNLCHPKNYIFTDKSLDVLNVLAKNIEINIPRDTADKVISKQQFVWDDVNSDVFQLQADFIFGADIVFDPSGLKDLATTLKMLLTQGVTRCAYIVNTLRCIDTNNQFLSVLEETGLKHEIIKTTTGNIFFYNESAKFVFYKIFYETYV